MKLNKKYHKIILMATMIAMATPTFATPQKNITIYNDGNPVALENNPYLSKSNRVMIPFRQVGQMLNLKIEWQAPFVVATGTNIATNETLTIKIQPNSNTMLINDKPAIINDCVELKENRTYIPLRLFSETFGFNINWLNGTVYIKTDTVSPEPTTPPIVSTVAPQPIKDSLVPVAPQPAEDPVTPVAPQPAEDPVAPVLSQPTEKPVAPIIPVPTEKPVVPVIPVPTEKPAVPVIPVPTEKPVVPVVPVPTEKPVVPVVPVPTEKPVVPVVPVPTEKPVVPVTPDPTPINTSSVSAIEQRVLELVNIERKNAGLQPLILDAKLSDVAREKSKDMKVKGYFDHTSPTYGSPFDMMKQFGISYRAAGENIAYGYPTAEAVVTGWMNSPGHRANILNPTFTHIGIGYYADGNYWTQMFITP